MDINITDGSYTQISHYNLYGELGRQSDALFGVKLYRNKAGQITKKIETLQGKKRTYTYRYDERGRLTTVRKNRKAVEHYTYDSNGNRLTATSKERNITNQLQSYNADDEITLIGQLEQSYDEDGYLTAITLPEGSRYTYSYNTLGALTDATLPDSTQIHYITDPLNRRIAKEVNGTIVEKYLWEDLTTLLAIYDGNDNLIQRFEYADGRMPISMTDASGKRYYLHYDQVGSLRAVSRVLSPDNTIELIKEITYDTYGNIINDTNPSFKVPFGFAGGLYDSDTKLTHFGYREYDAYTGKWTAKDPIGFAGGDSNLYGYVWSDPVNWIDENGLTAIAIPFTPTISPVTIFPTLGAGMVYESAMLGYDAGYALADWWDHYRENDSVMDDYVCNAKPVDKNKEPDHPDFVPHKKKKGLRKIPWNKNRKGYPDKNGNYWEPVPDGHRGTHDPHWDQQHPDGSHTPKYP